MGGDGRWMDSHNREYTIYKHTEFCARGKLVSRNVERGAAGGWFLDGCLYGNRRDADVDERWRVVRANKCL